MCGSHASPPCLPACNVWYLNSVEMESLTGHQAIQKALSITLVQEPPPLCTVVHFKVSAQGIMLTDNQRKVFGFMAWKQSSTTDNVCHLFAEHDLSSPSAIINFVSKIMIGSPRKIEPRTGRPQRGRLCPRPPSPGGKGPLQLTHQNEPPHGPVAFPERHVSATQGPQRRRRAPDGLPKLRSYIYEGRGAQPTWQWPEWPLCLGVAVSGGFCPADTLMPLSSGDHTERLIGGPEKGCMPNGGCAGQALRITGGEQGVGVMGGEARKSLGPVEGLPLPPLAQLEWQAGP
ncbi:Tensin-3 [Camelus dromedarius]|uniref:Tensin-3 n=1 Tax=Camelus dromedarius TaxID=9838 RepID=A0A5N4C4D2_CAMDR|nr:Tensin-3 [Camelus dromedarius]